jgi:hypothetical protein
MRGGVGWVVGDDGVFSRGADQGKTFIISSVSYRISLWLCEWFGTIKAPCGMDEGERCEE